MNKKHENKFKLKDEVFFEIPDKYNQITLHGSIISKLAGMDKYTIKHTYSDRWFIVQENKIKLATKG